MSEQLTNPKEVINIPINWELGGKAPEILRLECLKLAVQINPNDPLKEAKKLYKWVSGYGE